MYIVHHYMTRWLELGAWSHPLMGGYAVTPARERLERFKCMPFAITLSDGMSVDYWVQL